MLHRGLRLPKLEPVEGTRDANASITPPPTSPVTPRTLAELLQHPCIWTPCKVDKCIPGCVAFLLHERLYKELTAAHLQHNPFAKLLHKWGEISAVYLYMLQVLVVRCVEWNLHIDELKRCISEQSIPKLLAWLCVAGDVQQHIAAWSVQVITDACKIVCPCSRLGNSSCLTALNFRVLVRNFSILLCAHIRVSYSPRCLLQYYVAYSCQCVECTPTYDYFLSVINA